MTTKFSPVELSKAVTVTAPDGSRVDILAQNAHGSMARFSLDPHTVSKAVRHRTVQELWYIVAGIGEMWLSDGTGEEIIALAPGLSLSIPTGTSFQFRSLGDVPLEAIGVTMPPWPGMDEAEFVPGKW
ncbi:MAG: cupin domain-containing protein [Hyphomicrobiaceae bacterium]|nr:cupin domain-containing protein [Hyphomicrobiaceae bacterium]